MVALVQTPCKSGWPSGVRGRAAGVGAWHKAGAIRMEAAAIRKMENRVTRSPHSLLPRLLRNGQVHYNSSSDSLLWTAGRSAPSGEWSPDRHFLCLSFQAGQAYRCPLPIIRNIMAPDGGVSSLSRHPFGARCTSGQKLPANRSEPRHEIKAEECWTNGRQKVAGKWGYVLNHATIRLSLSASHRSRQEGPSCRIILLSQGPFRLDPILLPVEGKPLAAVIWMIRSATAAISTWFAPERIRIRSERGFDRGSTDVSTNILS
jgi:hypothetical protein